MRRASVHITGVLTSTSRDQQVCCFGFFFLKAKVFSSSLFLSAQRDFYETETRVGRDSLGSKEERLGETETTAGASQDCRSSSPAATRPELGRHRHSTLSGRAVREGGAPSSPSLALLAHPLCSRVPSLISAAAGHLSATKLNRRGEKNVLEKPFDVTPATPEVHTPLHSSVAPPDSQNRGYSTHVYVPVSQLE